MSVLAPKSRTLLPVVCALALVVAGCGGAQSRKIKHLEKGQSFLAADNFEKARVEFRNALQIAPKDSEARYDNGLVAEKMGNLREAAQFYQGAIESNSDNLLARSSLGRIYVLAGAPDKAIETVNPGLQKHPDEAALLTVRAAAGLQLKNTDGAIKDAERAVQLAPNSDDAVAVLAGIYKSQDQAAKAQALLRETIKRNPNTVELRLVLAQLDGGLGQQAEAEALLIDLVRMRPKEKSHRLRLAQFYSRTDHTDEAERVLRDAIKSIPDERDLKKALIEFLAARRGRETAVHELDVMIAANPRDHDLKFVQAQFYEQGKETSKAEAVYKQVIDEAKLDGAGLSARNRLASLRVQANDIAGAEKLLAEVLAKSPRDDDALVMRGNLALVQKDPRTAIADLRSVLRDQPNAVGVMRSLARAHLANGEAALAEETMRRAVEANPQDSSARLDFAQLLTQLGKAEQAKPVIDELVKQQPGNAAALDAQFKVAIATRDLVAAKSAADALAAAQPKSSLGYFYQGEVAEADKRLGDAVRYYSMGLDAQPDGAEPLEALTRVLVALKRTPEALKRLDDVMARYPEAPSAANIKGDVLLSMQQSADASLAFKTAIERAPKWWVPYRNLAAAQAHDHHEDAAAATLQSGIAHAAIPDELELQLALFYEHTGNLDAAVQVYEAALRRNPQADIASNNLAMLLVTYKKDPVNLQRAKELASRFASSANPNFLDTYGWVLYKGGEAAAAVAALQAASAKALDAPVPLYHLGMAEVLAGQPEAARESLTRSLQSGKKFQGMDEAKATLDKLPKDASANIPPAKS
jgi:tetratricopeptide (TPR) repeat protein